MGSDFQDLDIIGKTGITEKLYSHLEVDTFSIKKAQKWYVQMSQRGYIHFEGILEVQRQHIGRNSHTMTDQCAS